MAGAPLFESLFLVSVLFALRRRLIRARELIIESAPLVAWRRTDPDATDGHAPAHHPPSLVRGFRVHTLLCRGAGLPLQFWVSPAKVHDAPFARPLLELAVRLSPLRPRGIRLDAASWGLRLLRWSHETLGAVAVIRFPPETSEKPLVLTSYVDKGRTRKTQWH